MLHYDWTNNGGQVRVNASLRAVKELAETIPSGRHVISTISIGRLPVTEFARTTIEQIPELVLSH